MKSIPANKIERMSAVNIGIDDTLFFDQYLKISYFIIRFEIAWTLDIPFAKWRVFH